MENSTFTTGTSDRGGKVITFKAGLYGRVIHATPKESQRPIYYGEKITDEVPSTDVELLKAWSHATIERKYGVYASKPFLEKELIRRGYVLTENKHRWKKVEQPEATEA